MSLQEVSFGNDPVVDPRLLTAARALCARSVDELKGVQLQRLADSGGRPALSPASEVRARPCTSPPPLLSKGFGRADGHPTAAASRLWRQACAVARQRGALGGICMYTYHEERASSCSAWPTLAAGQRPHPPARYAWCSCTRAHVSRSSYCRLLPTMQQRLQTCSCSSWC